MTTRASVSAILAFSAASGAALVLLAVDPSPAEAQRSPLAEGELCPTRLYAGQDDLICRCTSTAGGNPVWGTDTYTDDSALCHAALHAGAITPGGGVIHVRRVTGQDSYRGSTRNGITSRDYGGYESSMAFDSPQVLAKTLGGVRLCPVLYSAAPGMSGDCRCEPGRSGPAWGTNPYTADSAVCSAAHHAGLIDSRAGGVIHIAPGPKMTSVPGSTRNGFSTSDFDSAQPWNTFVLSRASQ